MRKVILAIVVALIGVVGINNAPLHANGGTTISVIGNNSRFVEILVTKQPTRVQYILVCNVGATECTPANAENSNKVVRFDCYRDTQTTPTPCGDQSSVFMDNHAYYPASTFSFILKWRPNSPSNYSYLPAGTYNLKVFESDNGSSFTEVANEQFSFPQFSFTYDQAPSMLGEPVVGSTLSLTTTRWTPEPTEIFHIWLRCKAATGGYPDYEQIDPRPYTMGFRGDNTDCLILESDGSVREPTFELVSVRRQSQRNFTSYTITDADLGSYIAVHVTPQNFDSGLQRQYVIASTPVIEKKTAPVNQTAPVASFKATKKFKKLVVGAQVTTTAGTWKWANTTTYQWFSCTKRQKLTTTVNAKQCTAVKKATKATYKVKKADKGRFVVARISAENEIGKTVLYANTLKKIG
jgi:hypothetical protein